MMEKRHRPIFEIAAEIKEDWYKPAIHAVPYLMAMQSINLITDMYYYDTAYSVVLSFLNNTKTWKGEVAREIKKELNEILKGAK